MRKKGEKRTHTEEKCVFERLKREDWCLAEGRDDLSLEHSCAGQALVLGSNNRHTGSHLRLPYGFFFMSGCCAIMYE